MIPAAEHMQCPHLAHVLLVLAAPTQHVLARHARGFERFLQHRSCTGEFGHDVLRARLHCHEETRCGHVQPPELVERLVPV